MYEKSDAQNAAAFFGKEICLLIEIVLGNQMIRDDLAKLTGF